jgi:3-oxoacyl-[acyl-carrier-protein] synthase II
VSQVVICKAAVVSALGEGLDRLWHGLLAGQSGIGELTRFDCGNYISRYAATIDGLKAGSGRSLLDDLLERVARQLGPVPADSRLLTASTKGEIDLLTESCRNGKPVPETVLFEPFVRKVAGRFELESGGVNINAACASSTIAVMRGAGMIAAGRADAVLVYAADLVSEFVFSGFSALQALSGVICRPFDRNRNGLNLGEAGVALLLMSAERARSEGRPVLARVAGWGAANDAHHVTAPARDGSGLILACRQALEKAGIEGRQLAAINAHGTGTVYNDAMELTAFNSLFGDRLPPLHGVKGSLGHCLGAAGAVEIAIGCRALHDRKIPGTVGCELPEEAGRGRLSAMPQEISGDYLLCSNSGFGGINAAVVLQGGCHESLD